MWMAVFLLCRAFFFGPLKVGTGKFLKNKTPDISKCLPGKRQVLSSISGTKKKKFTLRSASVENCLGGDDTVDDVLYSIHLHSLDVIFIKYNSGDLF